MAKAKRNRLRGARRMKEFGYKLVSVWFDKSEADIIEVAARAAGKPVATYVRERAWQVACSEVEQIATAKLKPM